jgi:hypothetical protein
MFSAGVHYFQNRIGHHFQRRRQFPVLSDEWRREVANTRHFIEGYKAALNVYVEECLTGESRSLLEALGISVPQSTDQQ